MSHYIVAEQVTKEFKVSKRSKGIPGMVANMLVPKYELKRAVDGISFHIDEGEMVGFIGPNGAGKSTMIKMLSGILHPTSGSIRVGNYVPYQNRKKYVGSIGVVFGQKSQLQWDLPPIDTYELLRYVYRIPTLTYKKNLTRLVELLEMEAFLNQPVRQLSLGQRMRADIVAALIHSPRIVFFDEPTIGVDVVGKETIRNFIRELNCSENTTMIFTTHDMQDIEKTCERLIIIDHGHKEYDGSLTGIRNKYATTRQLDVEFLNEVEVDPIPKVVIMNMDELEGRKKRFIFQNNEIEINELMQHLLGRYQVKDLHISEPEIESIIRRIYDGEFSEGGALT